MIALHYSDEYQGISNHRKIDCLFSHTRETITKSVIFWPISSFLRLRWHSWINPAHYETCATVNKVIVNLDNVSLFRRQAIILTNAEVLLILDSQEKKSVKFESRYSGFYAGKLILKYCLQKNRPFCLYCPRCVNIVLKPEIGSTMHYIFSDFRHRIQKISFDKNGVNYRHNGGLWMDWGAGIEPSRPGKVIRGSRWPKLGKKTAEYHMVPRGALFNSSTPCVKVCLFHIISVSLQDMLCNVLIKIETPPN